MIIYPVYPTRTSDHNVKKRPALLVITPTENLGENNPLCPPLLRGNYNKLCPFLLGGIQFTLNLRFMKDK